MGRVVEGGGRNLSVRMNRAESGVWPETFCYIVIRAG